MKTILISSCLLGVPCRWHGRKLPVSSFVKKLGECNFISVCPEELGGLPTPRPPVKRRKGKVFETCSDKSNRKNVTGKEVTEYFIKGAEKTLEIANKENIKTAVLCSWSPSCGETGITKKLLESSGIKIINTF